MTLNEIAYNIIQKQGKYEIGSAKYDDALEVIKDAIINHYALYVRRDYDRNGGSDEYYTTITIELESVDKSDAICQPVNCIVKRSKNKIPKRVRTKDNAFKYIGNIDRTITFTRTRLEELRFTYSNDFTSNIPRYIMKNEYLYVFNWKRGKYVSIEDIFIKVTEDDDICQSGVCYDYDEDDVDMPIPADILTIIETEVLKEIVNL
jgi:hypothetical protein